MNNDPTIDWKAAYEAFVKKVKKMRDLQKAYFKSNKDHQILLQSKESERQVDEVVYPKPATQAQIDWLAR